MRKRRAARKTRLTLKTWSGIALICVRLCRQSLNNLARLGGNYETVVQVLNEYGAKISFRGFIFSPDDFKADRQHTLSRGARQLLQQEPSTRTDKDVNTLVIALRHIPAFAEYPKKMQWSLCRVGRLETFGPRRVVLSEGDVPTSFYFILSGSVVVTAYEKATETSRTLVTLTKGMSFGELAVVSNTRRQGTVSSRTPIELLSISREEFKEIFMAGGRNIMHSEKQRDFIRDIAFLRDWPIDRLMDDSRSCTVYYFDRGQVLVRDSNNSDWIYIVLKGSLSVMKKLKRKEAQLPRNSSNKTSPDSLDKQNKNTTGHGRRFGHTISFAESGVGSKPSKKTAHVSRSCSSPEMFKTPYELELKLEDTLPGYKNEKDRLESLNYDAIVENFRSRLVYKDPSYSGRSSVTKHRLSQQSPDESSVLSANSPMSSESLPDISLNNKVSQSNERVDYLVQSEILKETQRLSKPTHRQHNRKKTNGFSTNSDSSDSLYGVSDNDADINMRNVRKTAKGVYFSRSRLPQRVERKRRLKEIVTGEKQSHQSVLPNVDLSLSLADNVHYEQQEEETVADKLAKLQFQYQRRVTDREGRKTIAEEFDHRARRDLKLTEIDLDPTVIQVQVLERGQYFGLLPLLFPDQSSLSVISNGAECLVISKKLFLQFASEKCLRHLRNTEIPFPSESELNRKLQEMVNWQANRTLVYNNLADQVIRRKSRRKQFLPVIAGQYSFRNAPL